MSEKDNQAAPVVTETVTIQKLAEEPLKVFMQNPLIMEKFNEVMGRNSQSFITSVLQAVMSNDLLSKATPLSIYGSALTAATMQLPINPNLGFAYIVPYNNNKKVGNEWIKTTEAQLQIGWKGFVQLAQRSGQFRTTNSVGIYENQLGEINYLTGETEVLNLKPEGEIVGYIAHFSLLNGFEKSLYMSLEEVTAHGKKYSQAFKNPKVKSLWDTDFDSMAKKTVLKLLLARFAPLSIEMQTAVQADQAVINDNPDDFQYPDGKPEDLSGDDAKAALKNNDSVSPELP